MSEDTADGQSALTEQGHRPTRMATVKDDLVSKTESYQGGTSFCMATYRGLIASVGDPGQLDVVIGWNLKGLVQTQQDLCPHPDSVDSNERYVRAYNYEIAHNQDYLLSVKYTTVSETTYPSKTPIKSQQIETKTISLRDGTVYRLKDLLGEGSVEHVMRVCRSYLIVAHRKADEVARELCAKTIESDFAQYLVSSEGLRLFAELGDAGPDLTGVVVKWEDLLVGQVHSVLNGFLGLPVY